MHIIFTLRLNYEKICMLVVGGKIILVILLSVYKSPNNPTVSQGACSMSSAMSQCSQCHPLVPQPCDLRPLFCSFRKSHGSFTVVHRSTTSSSMFPLLNADPATTTIQSCSQLVTLTGMACSFCTNRTISLLLWVVSGLPLGIAPGMNLHSTSTIIPPKSTSHYLEKHVEW